MSRHHTDRDRSRDRHGGYRGRSQSPPDSSEKKKRSSHHHRSSAAQPAPKSEGRKVKFNDVPNVKVFRKEDEPNSKGLTDADIEEYLKKMEAERGSNAFNNNLERMKHFDAQLENNSIKQQKQKQKLLHEKLQAAREEIGFYSPLLLRIQNSTSPGEGSTERVALSTRLNDVLGCFYVQQSQIPSEPSFQIQNKNTSLQPKLINFDKQRIDNKDLAAQAKKKEKKDQKPLKSILKMSPEDRARERSESAPRRVDPNLIALLRQMQINKAAYPKERAQILLKPYKDSGELDYLKNNPAVLSQLMRSASVSNSVERGFPMANPAPLADPYKPRFSVSPQPEKPMGSYAPPMVNPEMKPMPGQFSNEYPVSNPNPYPPRQQGMNPYYYPPNYPTQMPNGPHPGSMGMPLHPSGGVAPYNPNPYPGYPGQSAQSAQQAQYNMTRNYKTVPCKYFHSPQGCVKAVGCTFIHDEEYAGRPTPSMLKSNRGMVMASYPPSNDNSQMGNNFYQGYPGGGDYHHGQN